MERSSLTFQTFRNIGYNIVGYIWPMVFALFVTPIIIFRLGVKDYGIYLFVTTFISLLGLLDLGLGAAVVKYMANYLGKNDSIGAQRLIHASNYLSIIISTTGLIAALFIAFFGPKLLPSQFASYEAYSNLFVLAGLIFFFNSIDFTYTVLLSALQRFDIANKIGVISLTLTSLITLVVVLFGGSVASILIIQLISTILVGIITFFEVKKILPYATLKFVWDSYEIKRCYSFGLVTTINSVANTALTTLDRLIIPFFVGPSNLTYYSVPGNVTSKIPGVANTLSGIIFPMTSSLDGSTDSIRINLLYVRSFRLITPVAASLTVTAIAFAHQSLQYWLNAEFANHSTNILIILAFTNFILALLGPLSNFLLGLGKLKFLTTMSIIMGVINAVLLIILLPKYGIVGAAWAYLISLVPIFYMFYYTEVEYLHLTKRHIYYTKKILGTFVTGGVVWVLDTVLLSHVVFDLTSLILVGLISTILYIIFYKLFGFFEEEDWKDIENFTHKVTHKIVPNSHA